MSLHGALQQLVKRVVKICTIGKAGQGIEQSGLALLIFRPPRFRQVRTDSAVAREFVAFVENRSPGYGQPTLGVVDFERYDDFAKHKPRSYREFKNSKAGHLVGRVRAPTKEIGQSLAGQFVPIPVHHAPELRRNIGAQAIPVPSSDEHTSELQSL